MLIGTLDTKGNKYAYVRDCLHDFEVASILVNAGILGSPWTKPDLSHDEVARAIGVDISTLVDSGDCGVAIDAISAGTTPR